MVDLAAGEAKVVRYRILKKYDCSAHELETALRSHTSLAVQLHLVVEAARKGHHLEGTVGVVSEVEAAGARWVRELIVWNSEVLRKAHAVVEAREEVSVWPWAGPEEVVGRRPLQ